MNCTDNIIIDSILDSDQRPLSEVKADIKKGILQAYEDSNWVYDDNVFYTFSNSLYGVIHRLEGLTFLSEALKKEVKEYYLWCRENIEDEDFIFNWEKLIDLNVRCKADAKKNEELNKMEARPIDQQNGQPTLKELALAQIQREHRI